MRGRHRVRSPRQTTCMDGNVAKLWETRLSVVGVVCVGYANKADGEFVGSARSGRGCSIEPTYKEKEGRQYEAVPGSGTLTMDDIVEAAGTKYYSRREIK